MNVGEDIPSGKGNEKMIGARDEAWHAAWLKYMLHSEQQ
jgi:hypothetical protein